MIKPGANCALCVQDLVCLQHYFLYGGAIGEIKFRNQLTIIYCFVSDFYCLAQRYLYQ